MELPLKHLRVLDLSSGPVGGMATMALADFGADVIKVERPGGDPFRTAINAPMWLRGKRSVEIDLKREVERERLYRLVETTDVVVTSFRAHSAVDLGCDYDVLASRNAGLVYCQISGFGPYGPYVGYPGYEGVVAAKAGRMQAFTGLTPREGPTYSAVQASSHATSQAAITGIFAALYARERIGFGQYVETSLLQGLLPYDLAGLTLQSLIEKDPDSWEDMLNMFPSPAVAMPTINYHPVQTKDGDWIQLGNLLQHLFENFIVAAELFQIYGDERYEGPPFEWPEEAREEFRNAMLLRMREKTTDEWMKIFSDHGGVVAHPWQTTQSALTDPDLTKNGHVIELPDGRGPRLKATTSVTEAVLGMFGETDQDRPPMKQLGPLARFTKSPAQITGIIPNPGQHTFEVFDKEAKSPRSPWMPFTNGDHSGAPALDGVLVLDFATIIAGPLASAHLADLGARVIKIEQPGGDPFRGMGRGGISAMKTNAGKESIVVDLKQDEGRAIVTKLLEKADIVIHNYRPGVPEKLEISYEDAIKVNPEIIYVTMNGYGSNGPSSHRPSTHPIPGAALGGAFYQAGYIQENTDNIDDLREAARRLTRANEVNPDPNTTAVITSVAMMGLYNRLKTGQGQEIFVDMMGANAWANADDFIWYDGKPDRPKLDDELMGTGATYRLYKCSEGWVFLGLVLEKEWHQFCNIIESPELAIDRRFRTSDARAENRSALESLLENLFLTDTADNWELLLATAGLGCVRADGYAPGEFWLRDKHIQVNEYTKSVEHGEHGPYTRHGPVVRLRRTPNSLGPAPMAGEQTSSILEELGYKQKAVTQLRKAQIVWSEPAVDLS